MTLATERRLRRARGALLLLTALVTLLLLAAAVTVVAVRAADAPAGLLLGGVALLVVLVLAAAVLGRLAGGVPRRTLLVLDLAEPLADLPPGDPRGRMRRDRPGLREAVEALDRAATDPRVTGLWCRIDRPAGGLADVQELRDAVLAFRAAGKFALAFSPSFGDFGRGTASYYLACAFDEVVLQPSGDVGLTGVAAEVTFLRGALDKVGVDSRLDHRHEYKSAKNMFTERAFTPAHREATERIVSATFDQVVDGIAAGRGLQAPDVRALVDRGPLLGPEALEAGLVDRLAYRDEALAAALQRAGDGARTLALADYHHRARSGRRRGTTTVALVHGVGAVTTGRSRPTPLTGMSMGADTVTAALREAVGDKRVRAVLFRIDSPGGSYIASDAIWREVVRARAAGTPVVASMGNVAGSGGYFVAMAADRIVAHPGTLTGSIGVVGGKSVAAGLRERLGLSGDEAHAGVHALMWSNRRDYSPSEWQRLQDWLDRCYDDFTAKAADGRGLDRQRMHELARGRVWVGSDAHEYGLVDTLGGYRSALDEVRGVLGLAGDAPLRVEAFPRRRNLVARLRSRGTEPEEDFAAASLGDLLPAPATIAADLGLGGGDMALLAPEPWRLR